MRAIIKYIAMPAVVLAAACQSKDDPKLDDALSKDLALASQVQPYQPQQFMSPQEAGYGYNPYMPQNPYAQPNPYGYPSPYGYPQRVQTAAQPTYNPAPAPARRTSSSSSSRSSGTIYRAPQEPVRNTKRDAVIGAAAGAVIGATTSRDKLKGAIIGGVIGGVLGGFVGFVGASLCDAAECRSPGGSAFVGVFAGGALVGLLGYGIGHSFTHWGPAP